jgi:hypothetical protein
MSIPYTTQRVGQWHTRHPIREREVVWKKASIIEAVLECICGLFKIDLADTP